MRLALVTLVLALPAASAAEPPTRPRAAPSAAATPLCRDDLRVRNARSPDARVLRRLGELPPGDLVLTVVNRARDCIEPVVVRQGYGLGR